MRTVMIESPFEGGTSREGANVQYAKRCMNDALRRFEAPYLSHLLYPHTLDDTIPEQRERGIKAGHAIASRLDEWCFYLDRGVTRGMLEGVDAAVAAGFRPYHVGFAGESVLQPYEKPITFRTFVGTGDDLAREIRLYECVHWPLLLDRFERIARQGWDLPRINLNGEADHG